jgi:hypothetical protein
VMRAQVQVLQEIDQAAQLEQAKLGLAEYVSQDDPVQGTAAIDAALVGMSSSALAVPELEDEPADAADARIPAPATAAAAAPATTKSKTASGRSSAASAPGGSRPAGGNGGGRRVAVGSGASGPTIEQGVAGRGPAPAPAAADVEASGGQPAAARSVSGQVVKAEHEKLGRNEPCWCGSGKKFKTCHGR